MTNDIKQAQEAVKSAEINLQDAKKYLEYLQKPKDEALTKIRDLAYKMLPHIKNVERRDSKVVIVDLSDQYGFGIVFGSDFIDKVFQNTGYRAVAFDHQKGSYRYRVWFQTTS